MGGFMIRTISLCALLLAAAPAAAQPDRYDPAPVVAAQRQAMARLSRMDGVWRGTAWTMTPAGRHQVVHTERVGTFLGGSVRMIEGRSYNQDGSVGFNALGVISYDPRTQVYSMQSWALGRSGSFTLRITDDGYVWELPAGPGTIVRYTATIRNGAWREVGERIAGNAAPVQIFEMNLRRVGNTDWPGAGPVPMR